MLFAIPYRESSLSNHFSKAPQIMLWDNQTKTKRILERPESSSCCGHKHFWRTVLQDNRVDAVVVRSIGSNMLSTLFKLNVRVFSAPRGFSVETFDENHLTPVTKMEFARPSAKKNKASCSSQRATHCSAIGLRDAFNGEDVTGQLTLINKCSPRAINHLAKMFKLSNQSETKQ